MDSCRNKCKKTKMLATRLGAMCVQIAIYMKMWKKQKLMENLQKQLQYKKCIKIQHNKVELYREMPKSGQNTI